MAKSIAPRRNAVTASATFLGTPPAPLSLAIRPFVEEPLFDDVDIGELLTRDYRTWERGHTPRDRFPDGESLVEAAERYAAGFERLAERPPASVFLVGHDIPLRDVLKAAAGSHWLDSPIHDGPHATAFLFDEAALRRAALRIRELAAVET